MKVKVFSYFFSNFTLMVTKELYAFLLSLFNEKFDRYIIFGDLRKVYHLILSLMIVFLSEINYTSFFKKVKNVRKQEQRREVDTLF